MKKRISFVEPIALHLPKSKLIIGLLMVLGLSFSLYSFAYIVREAFRYVSLSCDYDLWLLSDEEVKFYNLVTAFIAVIISQSFCFAFWFNRPRRFRERRHFYFVSIVNDQMALNSCFLSWFSKLALVYAITLGVAPMYYVFSLYPDYKFVFVLLIVVLFLQSWTTIRRVFKRESLKWMLVSAVAVCVIAFGISKINLIDYKELNEISLRKNVAHNYKLELPESDVFDAGTRVMLTKNVYLAMPKNQEGTEPYLIVDGVEVKMSALPALLEDWQSGFYDLDKQLLACRVCVDKSVKMKYVMRLKQQMARANVYRIYYAVVSRNPEYDVRYYNWLSFNTRIPSCYKDPELYREFCDRTSEFPNRIELSCKSSEILEINGKSYDIKIAKNVLKKLIQNDLDYVIRLNVGYSMRYYDYFNALLLSREAVDEVKADCAAEYFGKPIEEISEDELQEMSRLVPFRFAEYYEGFLQ